LITKIIIGSEIFGVIELSISSRFAARNESVNINIFFFECASMRPCQQQIAPSLRGLGLKVFLEAKVLCAATKFNCRVVKQKLAQKHRRFT